MSLNHILKTLIMNPRPFISQGDFMDRWAVSAGKVRELATEYSTPSGHAMAGASFYSYLYANVKSRPARIGTRWAKFSYGKQVAIVTSSSLILWLATRELSAWTAAGQPYTFLSYMGLLTGIVVAQPLETRRIDFDPRSSSVSRKALRCALSVGMVIGTLVLLDGAFGALSDDASLLGALLRFVRYATAGVVGTFIAPLGFVKMGLAGRLAR